MDPRGDQDGRDLTAPALSIVIPAYNEGDNIVGVLRRIVEAVRTRPFEVLVVYDFDEDTTVPAVRAVQRELPQVRLHRNTLGRGALNAIKSGLAAVSAPYAVVTMADGSDDPGDIDVMVRRAREKDADVVAASRYMRGGRQFGGPRVKRFLSHAAGVSLRSLGGLPVHDATNNFKLYAKRYLDEVTIESSQGFELALELTAKAHRLGRTVEEIPTTWRDRTAGQSNFELRRWLPHYLRWYLFGLAGRFDGLRRAR